MGDLLGSLIWGAKSGQYCVIEGGSLQLTHVVHIAHRNPNRLSQINLETRNSFEK
jgi:hypothetical protein